ncbi:hypothetical protein HU200_034623 [Digitaria exilis]|uniref:AAA+ ATPase domain-containing protein n=1 Tax=Digitaria exilis TaxID=1010633 RepID=A0A835BJI2_9POAL|nr:hypothetical protein HU200_034623 [Digitaria exilis]
MASTQVWAALLPILGFIIGLMTRGMSQAKFKLLRNKIAAYFSSYIQITIPEYGADRYQGRSDFFVAIEAYLSDSNSALGVRKLKAEIVSNTKKPQVSVDDEQEIIDSSFHGVTLWWYALTEYPSSNIIINRPGDERRRFYRVVFHKKFRDDVINTFLPRVIENGHTVIANNRQRRLFTNNPSNHWGPTNIWSHVAFQHPANFSTLAMDPTVKEDIINDLNAFKVGKGYYADVGKAWKRGYLLFGPPGTGKSTMIAAIANELGYDVYDLELTAVKNNSELRRLFIETKEKSVIVIEDIDCSVNLTSNRQERKKPSRKKSGGDSDDESDDGDTKLTLSGVLNFIDGLWSACGGERIIIFTTNNKDELDPALIRRGRMDKHIEMSYCRFEAFKVLASNYLKITEDQFFQKFGEIHQLLGEVDMSPADVAEHLMRMGKKDADACLQALVDGLRKAKDIAIKEKVKANEEVVKSMGKEVIIEAK